MMAGRIERIGSGGFMTKRWLSAAACLTVAAALWAAPSRAGEDSPALLAIGVGYFDVLQSDDTAADFRLEYRHGKGLWWFKPWAGVEATSDGTVFGLGGILLDIPLGRRFALTPSVGVGAYGSGDGKDLGNTVEFRSQVEVAYRFENNTRLGISFGHISNAGLGNRNPGVEIVNLTYAIPLGALLGE